MKLTTLVKEMRFALRNTSDWRSCAKLLSATSRFHIGNKLGWTDRARPPIDIDLRLGGQIRNVRLREHAGDLFILYEVMAFGAYSLPNDLLDPRDVRTIVDCGANVGITSLYWASRYPNATIVAIEPDPQNFELLSHNCRMIDRIHPVRAAVVGMPRSSVSLSTNRPAWGNRILEGGAGDGGYQVEGVTIGQIMERHGLSTIDLLKVDIEGGEKDVFTYPAFLAHVGLVVIELHDDYTLDRFQHAIDAEGFQATGIQPDRGIKIVTASPRP